jgi:hypothetical protein
MSIFRYSSSTLIFLIVTGFANMISAATATIYWQPVTHDTSGNPLTKPVHYYVYRDTVPTFTANTATWFKATSDTFVTDSDSRLTNPSLHLFYVVKAVDAWGNESVLSSRVGEVAYVLARAKIWLQLYYQSDADSMVCSLQRMELLPFLSPYGLSARFAPYLSGQMVDWILVQLLRPDNGQLVGQKAFLLKSNGQLCDVDGQNPNIWFPGVLPGSYRLTIRHRNHLAAYARQPLFFDNESSPLVDVTADSACFLNSKAAVELEEHVWGMAGGDLNDDNVIDEADFQLWKNFAQIDARGYQAADLDADARVTTRDYLQWYVNRGMPITP